MHESCDKPFVLDNGQIRYLYFSFDFIQSAMRISDPDALDLRYTQKMMAFLLFNPDPLHVAVLGLGGGSIAKFCYRRLPRARVTAVEINPDVVALRDEFCIPRDDARLRIVCGDGAAFVAGCDGELDALLVDAYDREGLAPGLSSRRFFDAALRSLAPGGVLVVNLAGRKEGLAPVVSAIIDVFDGRVLAVQVRKDEHHILFAFRDASNFPGWRDIAVRAGELRRGFGLDFPGFARKLEQAASSQLAWALSAAAPGLGFDADTGPVSSGRGFVSGDRRRPRRKGKKRYGENNWQKRYGENNWRAMDC
ncbi:MAG: spermidine synthase [Betaproteobacteria bacterium]